jgi:hypothetical protein
LKMTAGRVRRLIEDLPADVVIEIARVGQATESYTHLYESWLGTDGVYHMTLCEEPPPDVVSTVLGLFGRDR